MIDNSLHRNWMCPRSPQALETLNNGQYPKTLKANAYCGTPSFLLNIAEKAEEMGLDLRKDLNLKVGYVATEMLPESLRSRLEEQFG